MEINHQLIQEQKTIITQKWIEHLEILQMPCFQLEKYVAKVVLDNPLLEYDPPELFLECLLKNQEDAYRENPFEYAEDDNNNADFLSFYQTSGTLREYVHLQVREVQLGSRDQKIAFFLIENMDADGYFREDIRELARILKVPVEAVKDCVSFLQTLEPAGVFARTLSECLILQLQRKGIFDEKVYHIIRHFLPLLSTKSFVKISAESGISIDELKGIYQLIKKLNPKPGVSYNDEALNQHLIPDLVLQEIDGQWAISVHNDTAPRVHINRNTLLILKNSLSVPDLKKYVKKSLSSAMAFIKALEQRGQTMVDVARCIVSYQDLFFRHGYEYLKPFTMQMAADMLGIHVSTVSRAVNGKYVQTPKGMFALKYFFSSKLGVNTITSEMSSISVKNLLRQIIDQENKNKPYSDEKIKELLNDKGIQIARRTVAKYREELFVLPASKRKMI